MQLADLFYENDADLQAHVALQATFKGGDHHVAVLRPEAVTRNEYRVSIHFPPIYAVECARDDHFFYKGEHVTSSEFLPDKSTEGQFCKHTVVLWSNGKREPIDYQI